MSTVTENGKQKGFTLLRPNPVLNRLRKVEERSAGDAVTYAGVAAKTTFFLIMTLIGIVLQLIVKNALAGEPVWQSFEIYKSFTLTLSRTEGILIIAVIAVGFISEMIGIFARKTIPVTGTIYSITQGYLISFLVFNVLKGYEYLGLEALLLTVAVVAVMSWLYSNGIIRNTSKYRTVLLTLIIGSITLGVFTFIGSLIPVVRPYVQTMMGNPLVAIGLDVIGLIIAALFLISDFSMVETCVQEGYPKEYEWACSFGLVFTVLWIYLKILDLLMQIVGNKNKN